MSFTAVTDCENGCNENTRGEDPVRGSPRVFIEKSRRAFGGERDYSILGGGFKGISLTDFPPRNRALEEGKFCERACI